MASKPIINNKSTTNVKVVYAGGNGLQEAYKILAKIVLRKLQEEKEQQNESSDLYQSEH